MVGGLTVELAGTDLGLALLDGLVRTLPIGTLSPGGLAVTQTAAEELGVRNGGASKTSHSSCEVAPASCT